MQSHPFLMSQNFETQVANNTESQGINQFLRIKEIVEQGLGHLFIASSSSHFFNKTDFERYLLKKLRPNYQKFYAIFSLLSLVAQALIYAFIVRIMITFD